MNTKVIGTDENDKIVTGSGDDIVIAGKGDDTVTLGSGDDVALGGEGKDLLKGDQDGVVKAGDNLITNGSFENFIQGGKTGWGQFGLLEGWNVEGHWSELPTNGYLGVKASDGDQWVDMAHGGPGDDARMSQTIANLEAGAEYALSMDAALQSASFPSHVEVWWNGDLIGYLTPETRDMVNFDFTVVAGTGDGSDTLKLIGVSEKGYVGIALDNVEMYAAGATTGGDDALHGGLGSDYIDGQGGDDLLAARGAGAEWQLVDGKWVYDPNQISQSDDPAPKDTSGDVLVGGDGDDVLLGHAGNDTLSGNEGDDRINAGSGNDFAYGDAGDDRLNLEDGDDYGEGGAGDDVINAGAGNDVVFGDGAETFEAGGNDKLRGGEGDDILYGNGGDDILHGGVGDDYLSGDDGDDELHAGTGDDFLFGGTGADKLRGQAGDDHVSGGDGDDYLSGGSGDDTLTGGAGTDKIVGGSGADVITGGEGTDHMWGGEWKGDNEVDTYVMTKGGGNDYIHDFETKYDQIDLSAYKITYDELVAATKDLGGETIIDFSALEGGNDGDKLILKNVALDDLDESNFIL